MLNGCVVNCKGVYTLKTLFVSTSNKNFDGRTRALINAMNSFTDVIEITSVNGKDTSYCNKYQIKLGNNRDYCRFVVKCISIAKKNKDVDCLIIDNRKATVIGLILKKLLNPKFTVYDARELYFSNEMTSFYSKMGCYFEKKLIETSDIVIAANKERKAIMQEYYNIKNNIIVFENIRKLEYSPQVNIKKLENTFSEYFSDNKFNIISTAGCDLSRNVKELIYAVKDISFDCKLFIVGCKNDSDYNDVKKIITDEKIKDIVMLPMMNENRLKFLISNCNLGIVSYHKKNANNLFCASGKIYEFLYEGIPVATSDNPPLKKIVEMNNVGASSNSIKDAICDVYNNYMTIKEDVNNFIERDLIGENQTNFISEIKKELHIINEENKKR